MTYRENLKRALLDQLSDELNNVLEYYNEDSIKSIRFDLNQEQPGLWKVEYYVKYDWHKAK